MRRSLAPLSLCLCLIASTHAWAMHPSGNFRLPKSTLHHAASIYATRPAEVSRSPYETSHFARTALAEIRKLDPVGTLTREAQTANDQLRFETRNWTLVPQESWPYRQGRNRSWSRNLVGRPIFAFLRDPENSEIPVPVLGLARHPSEGDPRIRKIVEEAGPDADGLYLLETPDGEITRFPDNFQILELGVDVRTTSQAFLDNQLTEFARRFPEMYDWHAPAVSRALGDFPLLHVDLRDRGDYLRYGAVAVEDSSGVIRFIEGYVYRPSMETRRRIVEGQRRLFDQLPPGSSHASLSDRLTPATLPEFERSLRDDLWIFPRDPQDGVLRIIPNSPTGGLPDISPFNATDPVRLLAYRSLREAQRPPVDRPVALNSLAEAWVSAWNRVKY